MSEVVQQRGSASAPGADDGHLEAAAPGSSPSAAPAPTRNPGEALDLDWALAPRVNRSAVERRTETLAARRAVKDQAQTAWLLQAVTLLDLTTLSGDDTPGRVRRLCGKAVQPVRRDVLDVLGARELHPTVAAVCVYHALVPTAVAALAGADVPVCAVSTGFPAGQISLPQRLDQIRASVEAGAREIDIVIHRPWALLGQWRRLYDEVRACKEACGEATMKTILATGELGTLERVARTSRVVLQAGSDFIKTSTGKEKVNATLPVGLTMLRALRDYQERTGIQAGFKPAGGIATATDAIGWLRLVREELGADYVRPTRLRLGASSVLGDLERQLEHRATGRYSARHRHPQG